MPSKDKKKVASTAQLQGSPISSTKTKGYSVSGNSKPTQSGGVALEQSAVRKLTRATTVTKTAETAKRQKERLVQHRKLLKRRAQLAAARKDEMRPLTQAEILEEAKITEKLNLESLKRFQEMELEAKKKARNTTRKALTGSYISYRSTSMPLIQEISRNSNGDASIAGNGDDRICVDDEYEEEEQNDNSHKREELDDISNERLHEGSKDEDDDRSVPKDNNENEMQFRVDSRLKQERTFVTFSDYDTFRSNFPGQKRKEPTRQPIQQKICPITRLPAKYFDPVTRLPYANLQAFRILREAYYTQLELKGDRNDPEIKEWLEWRQKCKGNSSIANKSNISVNKSNVSQSLNNTATASTVLSQVSRPPASFSHLVSTSNQASTVLSQPSTPVATTQQTTVSTPNIVFKSQIVANNSSNSTPTTNTSSTLASPVTNQQIATLTATGSHPHGAIVTATTPQRGLSALAVAVRQQHLQQQLLQQQQQQQIIANLVTTISPASATAYLTSVTAAQPQNQTATGVQVVSTSPR